MTYTQLALLSRSHGLNRGLNVMMTKRGRHQKSFEKNLSALVQRFTVISVLQFFWKTTFLFLLTVIKNRHYIFCIKPMVTNMGLVVYVLRPFADE